MEVPHCGCIIRCVSRVILSDTDVSGCHCVMGIVHSCDLSFHTMCTTDFIHVVHFDVM